MSFTLYSYHEYTFNQQRVNQMDIGRPGIRVVDQLAWFSMIEELKSVFTEFLEHNWTTAGDRINLAMVDFLATRSHVYITCFGRRFWKFFAWDISPGQEGNQFFGFRGNITRFSVQTIGRLNFIEI